MTNSISARFAPDELESRTQRIGRRLATLVDTYRPSPAEAIGDRGMVLLAATPSFRSRLLRFIDALAGLDADRSGRETARLLREYLRGDLDELPRALAALIPLTTSEVWPPPLVAAVARLATRSVARRFIADGGEQGVVAALTYLRRHSRFASFDVLGEYVASEQEADSYRDQYLRLIAALGKTPEAGTKTASGAYTAQVSLKLSSLTADFNPVDPRGTVARVLPRLQAIIDLAVSRGVGVTLDMERYETRELVLNVFLETFGRGGRFAHWDGIGIVLQSYLRDAGELAGELSGLAAQRAVPFQIRLVKGAYWDYESIIAQENGWPVPVWEEKWQTDNAFERLSEELIAIYPRVSLAIASHNIRSHAHAEAVRELEGLPKGAVEHQTLFRTAEGISRALSAMGCTSRDYVPIGELLPGMAYLVRRILENSSQSGFLLQSRSGETVEDLLKPPMADHKPRPQAAPVA